MKDFDLDIPKMGYILLVKGNGIFSKFIRERQKIAGYKEHSEYTHCEILCGGKDSVLIAPPKSRMTDITKQYKNTYIKIMRIKPSFSEKYENKYRYKIAVFAASLCNRVYDVIGVASFLSPFKFILNWIAKHNRLYFCSEGCTWAIQKVYPLFLNGRNKETVMPCMFSSNTDQLEIVWEGIIP